MKIVIKIGTSSITHSSGFINYRKIKNLCQVVSDLKNAGHKIILVSSGAIGMGVGKLGLTEKPKDISTKQAIAAIGQCELMDTYDHIFRDFNQIVAQLLLTKSDFTQKERLVNLKNTINRLLELNVIPIVNENDTIATDEIKVGDNDSLSAFVAVNLCAEQLIILSDINGLYNKDPNKYSDAKLIEKVSQVNDEIKALAGDTASNLGTGGMKTKLIAAKMCLEKGCDMFILNGNYPEKLYDIVDGKCIGCTKFSSKL